MILLWLSQCWALSHLDGGSRDRWLSVHRTDEETCSKNVGPPRDVPVGEKEQI